MKQYHFSNHRKGLEEVGNHLQSAEVAMLNEVILSKRAVILRTRRPVHTRIGGEYCCIINRAQDLEIRERRI